MERYLVRIANALREKPEHIRRVASNFEKSTSAVSLKNFRISEFAIEFDLFADDKYHVKKAIEKLVREHGVLLSERDLNEDTPIKTKQETVREVVKLFNDQRYWECHEVMESIWRREKESVEKQTQQGVILAASALVHVQKNETNVCLGMIPRTLSKLGVWKEDYYYDLNVGAIVRFLKTVEDGKEVFFYPKI